MNRFAFFDVDNTIYNGYCASDLIEFSIEKGITHSSIGKKYKDYIDKYIKGIMSYSEISIECLNLFSLSVKGKTRTNVKKTIHEILHAKGDPILPWVRPVLKFLREHHFQIILVSAGPDVFVNEINSHIHADKVIATEIEYSNGVFTGKSPLTINDEIKIQKIHSIINDNKKSLSVGFGDSSGDIPMLEQMDKAFVIRNTHHPDMMKVAKKRGWILFKSEREIIPELKIITQNS